VNSDNWAAFGTAIWHPIPNLTFTGGLRYTNEHKDYTYRRLNYDGTRYSGPNGAFAVLDGTTANYNGNRLDYRGSIDYRFSPAVLAYATISTGFKGGGTNPRPFNAAQARSFNPETLTNYEIGLKTDLFDRRLRFNISTFYDRFTNIQIPVLSCPQFGGPGPCALPENAGNANITGVELETFIRPTTGLTIDGSLSYIHFKYRCVLITVVRALNAGETDTCSSDPAIINTQSSPPPGIPAWKWSWGIQYDIPAFGGTLTPRFDMSYQSHQNGGAGSGAQGEIASYTLANARLTWRTDNEHWQIAAEVSNLFDKYYFLNTFDLRGAGAGFVSAQPGHPREWTLTVTRRF
jgi:iron complex outermembrane receptor protein